ncbi:MAG: type I-E CRISPR-associated protein Cse1/CasA [Rhodobacteraceae bacterium]|nr:type I-E CRISPR-associated protein Cse1/CasA [Paracoccaceae bacterium]
MPLNLISDSWIPVRIRDGSTKTIAPHQMAEPDVLAPDWPRADLNLACYELLLGLVLLADPPQDPVDWRMRKPDSTALKLALERFAPAFWLTGKSPFLQEVLDKDEQPKPVDMLFIDSAGENAVRKNSDLMTWRGRYGTLDPALAAMALYTLQAFAPSGGAGNRTSMRGGGPMVTLIDPGQGLWRLIWANVPYGIPAKVENLPWMRPVRISEMKGSETYPKHGHPVEAFFGMPRRLRLVTDAEGVTGVIQKPWGTNYAGWRHPTSPYYRQKEGAELLPVHPKPGPFGYRNWLGIGAWDSSALRERAKCVETWVSQGRGDNGPEVNLRIAGWTMSNMTPVTFLNSIQPLITLPKNHDIVLEQMIRAADRAGQMLRGALRPVLANGTGRDAVVEEFFIRTEPQFHDRLAELKTVGPLESFAARWIGNLQCTALDLFDLHGVPGLAARTPKEQMEIVRARLGLQGIQSKKFTEFTESIAALEGEVV